MAWRGWGGRIQSERRGPQQDRHVPLPGRTFLYVDSSSAGSSSKVAGTSAPAALRPAFLALEVSWSLWARAPAWPNWTSVVNMLAQVPMHHAIRGFLIWPFLMASAIFHSSAPPT